MYSQFVKSGIYDAQLSFVFDRVQVTHDTHVFFRLGGPVDSDEVGVEVKGGTTYEIEITSLSGELDMHKWLRGDPFELDCVAVEARLGYDQSFVATKGPLLRPRIPVHTEVVLATADLHSKETPYKTFRVAIAGASGQGKSTAINVLTQKATKICRTKCVGTQVALSYRVNRSDDPGNAASGVEFVDNPGLLFDDFLKEKGADVKSIKRCVVDYVSRALTKGVVTNADTSKKSIDTLLEMMKTERDPADPQRALKFLPSNAMLFFVDARSFFEPLFKDSVLVSSKEWKKVSSALTTRSSEAEEDASGYPVVAILSHTIELLDALGVKSARHDPNHRLLRYNESCGDKVIERLETWFELTFGITCLAVDFQASNPPTEEEVK